MNFLNAPRGDHQDEVAHHISTHTDTNYRTQEIFIITE